MTNIVKEALGIFSNCILFLVKEHEPSKAFFHAIRLRIVTYTDRLIDASKGKCRVVQTGSSFDELHLSRMLFKDENGCDIIYPAIDFDFMLLFEEFRILDASTVDPSEKLRETPNYFAVMVSGSSPGYVKLLVTNIGREMLRRPNCDIEDDISPDGFLPNFALKKKSVPEQFDEGVEILYSRRPQYTCSGPALSMVLKEANGISYDFVYAFPCDTWPDVAINWTKRHRPDGWPPKHVIQDIVAGGCAVVPVGHHLSRKEEQDLEWRVSFNAAERKLTKCLLPLQRACYSLVKLIMKTTLSSECILTSYHVKNMMFWFCEQQCGKEDDWTIAKQGERILEFVGYIANALANDSIPNYFVPPNNMISHKSKDEIEKTRREVEQVRDKIVLRLLQACIKLHIFDQSFVQPRSDAPDIQTLLMLYVSFVKILNDVGLMNLGMRGSITGDLSDIWQMRLILTQLNITDVEMGLYVPIQCFANIVELNRCFRAYIKTGSHTYLAQSVPELLKPIAQTYSQKGNLNESIALYKIMLRADKNRVDRDFPEVYTNLACLYAAMVETVPKEKEKQRVQFKAKASSHFDQAFKLITDSSSLYLAYGNFLLDNKESVASAIEQFKKATEVKVPRADDDALIQLQLPGSNTPVGELVHVSGKVAAFYMLVRCYSRLDDVYLARKTANKLEAAVRGDASLKQKYPHFQICALSFRICGLTAKSEVLKNESRIYMKL